MQLGKVLWLQPVALALAACSELTPLALADGSAGKLVRFSDEGLEPFAYGSFLAGVEVIAGDPKFKVMTVDKSDRLKAGVWESTPGKWHFASGFDHWEYCCQ